MTNTRITNPEPLERRYPCILHRFGIRTGSGGRGRNPGGNGVVREIEFRVPLGVSLLSERRIVRPFGLAGGKRDSLARTFGCATTSTAAVRSILMLRIPATCGKGTELSFVSPATPVLYLYVSSDSRRLVHLGSPGGGAFGSLVEA